MSADQEMAHSCANAFSQHPGKCAQWCGDDRTCPRSVPLGKGWSSEVAAEPASEGAAGGGAVTDRLDEVMTLAGEWATQLSAYEVAGVATDEAYAPVLAAKNALGYAVLQLLDRAESAEEAARSLRQAEDARRAVPAERVTAEPVAWRVSGHDLQAPELWRHEPDAGDLALIRQLTDGEVVVEPLFAAPPPAAAPVAQPAEAGWKLVPLEPTLAMVDEVEHAARMGGIWTAKSVYEAMVAAAPLANAVAAPVGDALRKALQEARDFLRYCGPEANEFGLLDRIDAALSAPSAPIDSAPVGELASHKPSLDELRAKFGGWDVPEVSGKVNPIDSAPVAAPSTNLEGTLHRSSWAWIDDTKQEGAQDATHGMAEPKGQQ